MKLKKNSFLDSYYFLIIVLLPFWSFPFLPGSYRPISVFLLFPISVIYVFGLFHRPKMYKQDFLLITYATLAILQSFLLLIIIGGTWWVWAAGVASLIFGLFSYFGAKYILQHIGLEKFFLWLRISILITVVIGWIDLLGWLGILPSMMRDLLNYVVAGKGGSRIIITTSEPAWACAAISILLPFALNNYIQHKKIIDLFCLMSLCLFFVAALSMYGIVIAVVITILYFFWKFNFSTLCRLLLIFSIVCSGVVFSYNAIAPKSSGYYLSRISKLADVDDYEFLFDLNFLAAIDGSLFIRIGYPVIASKIFFENPMGVGVGRYGEYFNRFILEYSDVALSDPQVQLNVEQKNADQRNFLLKLFTESGWVLSIILIYFYWRSMQSALRMARSETPERARMGKLFVLCIFVAIANMLQFSTYLFISYWIVPALIDYSYRLKFFQEHDVSSA